MTSNIVAGLSVILLAYSITWFLLIKSVSIIKKIDEQDLKDIKEIKKNLDLRRDN